MFLVVIFLQKWKDFEEKNWIKKEAFLIILFSFLSFPSLPFPFSSFPFPLMLLFKCKAISNLAFVVSPFYPIMISYCSYLKNDTK